MADGREEENTDFYSVLGLKKECSNSDLRNAYKKLALRWHPDRCSASGNLKFVEDAKKKFQSIQEAYSVLSDANKRLLYDVGVYDSNDDDDDNGIGGFLNEMVEMMSQTQSSGDGEESFEELQKVFQDMFQTDIDAFGSAYQASSPNSKSYASCNEDSNSSKRNSSEINIIGKSDIHDEFPVFHARFQNFCLGAERQEDYRKGRGTAGRRRRTTTKHHVSSARNVATHGISA